MHGDLLSRRRVLALSYQRYLDADRRWKAALNEVKFWFPAGDGPGPAAIGNPGSRIRMLYEHRTRALLQFDTARQKLDVARPRLAVRQQHGRRACVYLLSYIAH